MLRILLLAALLYFSSSNTYSQAYYPLEVGNRWDYKLTEWDPVNSYSYVDTFSVIVIKDTLMQNGKKYFVLNTDHLGVSRYIRSDSNGIYYYIPQYSSEWLVYRNNPPIGEAYSVDTTNINSPSVQLRMRDTLTYFGSVVHFSDYTYDWLGGGHYIFLTDKFGPVTHHSSGDFSTLNVDSKLIGCRISCVVYGRLTSVEKLATKAEGFFLSGNYPNPFNPATTIIYYIPKQNFVVLKVFDMLGREVTTLVNMEQSAGEYKVHFDASSLPSGIYIYTIQAGLFRDSKKLLLLR